MPFDALVMRAVTRELEPRVVGASLGFVGRDHDTVYLSGQGQDRRWHVRVALAPALAHLCGLARRPEGVRPWQPMMEAVAGARVTAAVQPPWERVWRLSLEREDDIGRLERLTLVVELAGHLTNIVLVREDRTVFDALRRVAPGRPGRTVWPGLPYEPPPAPPDPCESGRLEDLPPWARRLGEEALPALCAGWQTGRFTPIVGPGDRGPEVWIRPWDARCTEASDWSTALDSVYRERMLTLSLAQLKGQVRGRLKRRLELVDGQLHDARERLGSDQNPERFRRLGDAILAFGLPLGPDARPERLEDPASGESFPLPWDEVDGSWADLAGWAYRRYQKGRSARSALSRLIPRLERDRAAIEDNLSELERESDPRTLQKAAADAKEAGGGARRAPFRRFRSRRGVEIWIGRTAVENQELTFRAARPDDLWFHVKQYPGSHVLLRCGRDTPLPPDIEDAAVLAAFFSRAGRGSQVAVDYTARKFVRKRPHAEPGAVLYTRERTLYVTPAPERLRELGAIHSLLDDPD